MHTNKLYTKAHKQACLLYFTSTRVECSKKLLTHKQGDPAAATATQVVNSLALPNLPAEMVASHLAFSVSCKVYFSS